MGASQATPSKAHVLATKDSGRCYGEYRCPRCNRTWMSANSWSNFGQQCTRCRINVYPHKQTPLEQPGGLNVCDKNKPHPQELCQKCRSLGYSCSGK